MEGTGDNPGINYRTMRELFRSIEEEHTADYSHEITASIVEIYNEVVHDLLFEEGKREMELQKTATGFDVVGLTEIGAPCSIAAPAAAACLRRVHSALLPRWGASPNTRC